jgi:hypothetical protein
MKQTRSPASRRADDERSCTLPGQLRISQPFVPRQQDQSCSAAGDLPVEADITPPDRSREVNSIN